MIAAVSHPHEVPKGWRKGERLRTWKASRYADRWVAAQGEIPPPNAGPALNDIAYIDFDSRQALDVFLDWWYGERKAFEAWVDNKHMLWRMDEPGFEDHYAHPWTQGAWSAWKHLHGIEVKE